MTDNIFELGIDSLLAARLFVEVAKVFGNKLPPAPLFQSPTIELLARHLREGRGAGRWTSLVEIQPEGSRPPLFNVHGGAGTIIHLQELSRLLGPDQPFYGLQSRGLYGDVSPLSTVREMASHYLAEIRSLQPEGPYYLSGYCFGGIVALEMAHRLLADGQEVPLLILLNAPPPASHYFGQAETVEGQATGPPAPQSRLDRLRAQMAGLGMMGRVGFLANKVGRSLSYRVRQLRPAFYLKFGLPMPDDIRDHYFLTTHFEAERHYVPRPTPAGWPSSSARACTRMPPPTGRSSSARGSRCT